MIFKALAWAIIKILRALPLLIILSFIYGAFLTTIQKNYEYSEMAEAMGDYALSNNITENNKQAIKVFSISPLILAATFLITSLSFIWTK